MNQLIPPKQKDGTALAAIIAAGIGCFLIGLATVLAEVSEGIKEGLKWYDPVGPLSGKTGIGVIVWLASWLVLHQLWRNREIPFGKIWILALLLIFLGGLGTFPPIFEAFAPV